VLIQGRCERLGRSGSTKVPHVGFDTVRFPEGSWLGESSAQLTLFHALLRLRGPDAAADGTCGYDGGFVAVVEDWPVVGVQFHPEKSQTSGLSAPAGVPRASDECRMKRIIFALLHSDGPTC
jgi:imidazole glycerol-phosphate synthase subunit HisH